MTCVYKDYEFKNGTSAMNKNKNKFLLGYSMKIVIQQGELTFERRGNKNLVGGGEFTEWEIFLGGVGKWVNFN